MSTSLIDLLVEFLPKSKENAITQDAISEHLGISKRSVRQLVQQARHDGHPICSTPYDGYWYSFDTDDINSTINILRSQADTLNKTMYDLLRIKEEESN